MNQPGQMTLFHTKVLISAWLVTTILYVLLIMCSLLSEEKLSPSKPAHCTCENVPDMVDVSVVNVSPCNLVCVDKRAPVLLYPLAIPDLRQLVSKLMWRSNFFPIQFHYELVEKIKFFKLRFVNSKGKTVGPSRINELYSSMAFPVVPLYWLTCKNLLWIFLKGLKPPSSGSTPCVN